MGYDAVTIMSKVKKKDCLKFKSIESFFQKEDLLCERWRVITKFQNQRLVVRRCGMVSSKAQRRSKNDDGGLWTHHRHTYPSTTRTLDTRFLRPSQIDVFFFVIELGLSWNIELL
jgi:hypothetical protein